MDSQEYIEEYPTTDHTMVLKFFEDHSIDEIGKKEFYKEFGTKTQYSSADVVGWLGY